MKLSNITIIVLPFALVATLIANFASAKTNNKPPHVHGEALVNLVIDTNTVIMEIDSPAINLLGFEQQPKTDERFNILSNTIKALNDSKNVILLNGGECTLTDKMIESPYQPKPNAAKTDQATTEATTKIEHTHPPLDEHGDINIHYQFSCKDSNAIKSISFPILTNYPRLMKLNAQWIFPSGQGAQTLTIHDNSIPTSQN